jgi:glycosyltransferase involved in cell wall biosynthesis
MPFAPVAIVLPPKEGFAPGVTGAIGLIVRNLAAAGQSGVYAPAVIGMPNPPGTPTFPETAFFPVTVRCWPPARLARRYAAAVARLLRPDRPALIEVHNRPDIAAWLADWLAPTPVSLFLNNDPLEMRNARRPAQRSALLANLAAVVTSSSYLRDRFLQHIPGGDVTVLPNPIDLAHLPPRVPMAERENLILFAGRVVADKGVDSFVEACARTLRQLPGWRAEIIGGDRFEAGGKDTPFIRDLRPRADAAGVRLLGYHKHDTVLQSLSRAAIAVVPSRWNEPFGMAALEAMACGAALICSGRGGLKEVVGDAAVLVDPEDPGAIAAAILALARDPARRAAVARAGLQRARGFDLPPTAALLDELRERILSAKWSPSQGMPISRLNAD